MSYTWAEGPFQPLNEAFHTQVVSTIRDATTPGGVLYHTLPQSLRDRVKQAGKEYMTAHAIGDMVALKKAENEIFFLVAGMTDK